MMESAFSRGVLWLCGIILLLSHAGVLYTQASHVTGINFVSWDGQQVCTPAKYSTPSDKFELLSIMRMALKNNESIKVVGGGLSLSGIQMSDDSMKRGHIISLDNMNQILNVDYDTLSGGALVEVGAGIRVRDLCEQLELLNLALPNLGATATQSIVGAATTGTHGTGTNLGCLATQIDAFELVDGQLTSHVVSASTDKSLFDAGRVGIGALGIIPSITLKTVPLFKLRKTTLAYSLAQLLIDLPVLMQRYERLQWSWTPYTDKATVIIREVVDINTPNDPRSTAGGDDGGCWSLTMSTANCTDVSYKALTDSEFRYESREIYTEMEMFIPIEYAEAAVQDFIEFMDSPAVKDAHDPNVGLSVMLRYVAADDVYLSPMYKRCTAVISFIAIDNQEEFAMYAQGLEALCESKYQGRVHWGKVNYANSSSISKSYVSGAVNTFDLFNEQRKRCDPSKTFMNSYLRQRLE
jgi:FAD/FMN-containing dehydrogenase